MTKVIFPTGHTYIRYEYDNEDTNNYPNDWEQNFAWTGRDDYLAWVQDWKLRLKAMIKAIREEKAIRRDRERDDGERNRANIERHALRIDCYNLLLLRRIGKIRAGQQRQQNKIAA
jgi:hypothetical protein